MLLAMFLFSLSMSLSPGPVNMLILSSSSTHGVGRSMAFVSGATIGFVLLLVLTGLLLGRLLGSTPGAVNALAWISAGFIAWVGWRIARSNDDVAARSVPLPSFLQGVALQWANPKAWVACMSGSALFAPQGGADAVLRFAAIYSVVCYASLASWAGLGGLMARLLTTAPRRRAFNLAMGLSLIASALWGLLG